MKKLSILIISSFVSAFLFASFAFAQDGGPAPVEGSPVDLKVYYSESIGQGERVYHLTACKKDPSYEPVTCEADTMRLSRRQCVAADGSLNAGTRIKGCLIGGRDAVSDYPSVNVSQYDSNNCPDADRQGMLYGPVWAIVQQGNPLDDKTKWMPVGKMVREGSTPPSETRIREVFPGRENLWPAAVYRTGMCVTWDVSGAGGAAQPMTDLSTDISLLNFYGRSRDGEEAMIRAGCNNNNSEMEIAGLDRSTRFDDNTAFSCSTLYRISGKTGTDILGQYISMLYKWAAGFVGIISVLIMVYSGIQISMAGGDTAKLDSAKNRILQSLIGLAILFLSGLILYTINPGFFK